MAPKTKITSNFSHDIVTANSNRTAVMRHGSRPEFWEEPVYLAVRGNASDVAAALLLDQKKQITRRYWRQVAVYFAVWTVLSAAFLVSREGHIPPVIVIFLVVVAFLMPAVSVSAQADPDGIEINSTIFTRLTPDERDTLFTARDQGDDVLGEVIRILTAKHSAADSVRLRKEQSRSQARARRLLRRRQ